MANRVFNNAATLFLSGDLDLDANKIYCMLTTDQYTPNVDTQTVTGDIGASAEVAASATYTGGGQELLGKTIQVNLGDDKGVFDANDVTWANSTITASGALLWQSGATPATRYLLAFIDFTENKSSSNGDFTISWNSEGIINLSGSG